MLIFHPFTIDFFIVKPKTMSFAYKVWKKKPHLVKPGEVHAFILTTETDESQNTPVYCTTLNYQLVQTLPFGRKSFSIFVCNGFLCLWIILELEATAQVAAFFVPTELIVFGKKLFLSILVCNSPELCIYNGLCYFLVRRLMVVI